MFTFFFTVSLLYTDLILPAVPYLLALSFFVIIFFLMDMKIEEEEI